MSEVPGAVPTDPVDAVLRLLADGRAEPRDLLEVLPGVVFGIAVDASGTAIVEPSPDGLPTVLVTTAPGHRERVDVPGWLDARLADLAAALPSDGVDVLLNPGGSTSRRVSAQSVRQAWLDAGTE
ncbi:MULTISPECIES: type VII secretion system-associated protein [Amycolatopsis]|uniref:type VII secretion system-associated protein n=1 Tax=Amycolatopsis TaxID=1813 RepID=UPI000B844354|nr:type VII secretion system-associated protein [Amycolatopsis sacchari]